MNNLELINSFLMGTKTGSSTEKTTTVVLGNEAADLDSIVSTVLYAFLLSRDPNTPFPVPVVNIPRNDFQLRTEAVYLFERAGIRTDILTFIDEIDLGVLLKKGRLQLILVDHNIISSRQEAYLNSVVEIIDHHADESNYPATAIVDIQSVGSNATLIAKQFLTNGEELLEGPAAMLLLGPILVDTANLNRSTGRVTDEDIEIVDILTTKTQADKQELYLKLQFEKYNVAHLSSFDLLRKDFKEWKMGNYACGISSVRISAADWLEKDPNIAAAFSRFLKEKKLDVLITMGVSICPEFFRDIGVFVPDGILREKILTFLMASDLELEKNEISSKKNIEHTEFYNQRNAKISRKRLQPLLLGFLANAPKVAR